MRRKVLLSAYACRPHMGSEPGVGWNVACQMAKHHEIWVLTRADNRAAIEAELSRNPIRGLHFAYYELPRWLRMGSRASFAVQFHYYLWQLCIFSTAQRLHRNVGFDITHHVTYVRYWSPSLLALLSPPFVWGPIGGGESAPRPFWRDFSQRARRHEYLRNLARWLGEHDPLVRLTAARSSKTLATTRETQERVRAIGGRNVEVWSQSGLSPDEMGQLSKAPDPTSNPPRIVSMGRMLHWKGYHLGIRAFAEAALLTTEYWLVGDGPERQDLEKLARSLGVSDRVKFVGAVEREQALQILMGSIALIHPSLHDSGSWVCLEAMAAGKPVICLDLGGPAALVTAETGFKVNPRSPEQAVTEIADGMRRLVGDNALRIRMGESGQKRAREEFSWAGKGEVLSSYYSEVERH